MANMELIEAKTLVATAPSITFSAIPQTYTDLKILVSARDDRAGQPNTDLSLRVGYNGTINTSSIYSARSVFGSGAVIASSSSATTYLYLGMANGPTATASTFGNTEIYIPNYTSANYKSVSTDGVSENNATTAYAVLNAGLISTTNPITDIQISANYGSGDYQIGSTFYLYGISNVTSTTKATGGIVSSDGTYNYHMFPFSGTFTPTQSLTADYLVVAGGGAGGTVAGNAVEGGGGGAGGLRSTVGTTGGGGSLEGALSLTAQAYTVTIGAGGAIGVWANPGSNGSNSVFSTITSTGGGYGGIYVSAYRPGASGGSGGGGGHATSGGGSATGGAGTANQGFAGGSGSTHDNNGPTGGGGGAGGVGGSASGGALTASGAGGVGVAISAFATATGTGISNYYAGGGGGGSAGGPQTGIPAVGGAGGGGNGAYNGLKGIAGTANTGGGGGGGTYPSTAPGTIEYPPGAGGSGIVIIRYAI